jgi:hypothetical protein
MRRSAWSIFASAGWTVGSISTSAPGEAKARRLADEPITLEELAGEFGVSRERVR